MRAKHLAILLSVGSALAWLSFGSGAPLGSAGAAERTTVPRVDAPAELAERSEFEAARDVKRRQDAAVPTEPKPIRIGHADSFGSAGTGSQPEQKLPSLQTTNDEPQPERLESLQSRFAAEVDDASRTDEFLEHLTAAAGDLQIAVRALDVQCRQSVCRVSAAFDDHDSARLYFAQAKRSGELMAIERIEDADRRVHPVVFIDHAGD